LNCSLNMLVYKNKLMRLIFISFLFHGEAVHFTVNTARLSNKFICMDIVDITEKRYASLDWTLIMSTAFPRAERCLFFSMLSQTRNLLIVSSPLRCTVEESTKPGKDFNLDRRAHREESRRTRVKVGKKSRARVLEAPALIKFLFRRCPSRHFT